MLGCVPLWLASGSGGVSRKTMGTVVIGGMLSATLLGIFIIPVTFYVIERLSHGEKETSDKPEKPKSPPSPREGPKEH